MRREPRSGRTLADRARPRSTTDDEDDDDDEELDDDELEDDDDEDEDDEDEDEDWEEMTEDLRSEARPAARHRSTRWTRSSSPTAAASTAPILACVATERSADRACASPPTVPAIRDVIALAIRIAREFGLRHEIIQTAELERPEYRANPANRCYYCKHELYTHLSRTRRERGAVVVDGNNADDRGDYRPGRQAAREFGVRSPLDEVGSDEGRNPRAVAPSRAADVGRAGVGVPVVAHSVSHAK